MENKPEPAVMQPGGELREVEAEYRQYGERVRPLGLLRKCTVSDSEPRRLICVAERYLHGAMLSRTG